MGQLGVPVEMANNLTVPVRITSFNYEMMTKLVNSGGANYVLKNGGKTRINLNYALFRKGTELVYGDEIHRVGKDGKKIVVKVFDSKKNELVKGDKILRGGVFLDGMKYPEKKNYKLEIGDIVERKLQDGDIVLLNPKFLS
jgi:DNA-directed RNA polymerase beta' subunit